MTRRISEIASAGSGTSRELDRSGVFPPVDVLPSLSRVMNAGIGERRTLPHHRAWSDQLYAIYAQGRETRVTARIVSESGRSLDETVLKGWELLKELPREEGGRSSE